jgi:hypothetical protein
MGNEVDERRGVTLQKRVVELLDYLGGIRLRHEPEWVERAWGANTRSGEARGLLSRQ